MATVYNDDIYQAPAPDQQGLESGGAGTADQGGAPGADGNPDSDGNQSRLTYEEMFLRMGGKAPLDEKQLTQQRKKEKRSKVFAALGDGLTALGNIIYSHAPVSAPSKTLSEQNRERWEKLRAEQQANNEAYMRAVQLDRAEALKDKQWAHQLEKDAKEEERKQAEDKMKAELHNLEILFQQGKIDEQGYKVESARIAAENAPQAAEDAHNLAVAKIGTETSKQVKNYQEGAAAGKKGSNGKDKTPWKFLGKDYNTDTYKEYEKDVQAAVDRYNKGKPEDKQIDRKKWVEETVTETNPRGKTTTTSKRVQKDKTIAELAGEVELRMTEQQESLSLGVSGAANSPSSAGISLGVGK